MNINYTHINGFTLVDLINSNAFWKYEIYYSL